MLNSDQGQTVLLALMQQDGCKHADMSGAFDSKMLKDSRGMEACTNEYHSPEETSCQLGNSWERQRNEAGEGAERALCSTIPERPGLPGPAFDRTLKAPNRHLPRDDNEHPVRTGHHQCSLLGGGKRAKVSEEDDILEDDIHYAERTTPGHLKDRLVVLQERALEAIQALPIQCADDIELGQVETRVWGLEALKHVLRMRMALQSNLMLCRPVEGDPKIPPAIELLAANLTLCIHNKGNRCYANSVMRMWCWMGAHHKDPAAFWGQSTKLCVQLLQQDEIEDIFWASEMQPVIARLDKPQQQHDASEFLVLMWELWQQTGIQGNWVSNFGGRNHEFDTIPIFVRLPSGKRCSWQPCCQCGPMRLVDNAWGKKYNTLCFTLGGIQRVWTKHNHKLITPPMFQCPQMTLTGHAAPANFVLRGVIAHQGMELISGHYITMLVEGQAVWVADDGECPRAVKEIPSIIQEGTVMVWASKAEPSDFWSTPIGTIQPPMKRPKILQDEVQIFYGNVTQWTKEVFQWLIQQDLQIVMMVETHLAGPKMEAAMSDLCRSRWMPTFLTAHETGRGGTSGGHAFCCREGQSAYKLHHYDHEGNGFLANVIQRQNWELCVISVYLKCGKDLNSVSNARVLGQVAALLQELAISWLLIGPACTVGKPQSAECSESGGGE